MNKKPVETIMGIVVLVVAALFMMFAYNVSDLQVVKGYEIGARFVQYFPLFAYLILIPSFIDIFKKNLANRLSYIFILSSYMTLYLVRFVYITI
jgi:uncharacterized membrane protein